MFSIGTNEKVHDFVHTLLIFQWIRANGHFCLACLIFASLKVKTPRILSAALLEKTNQLRGKLFLRVCSNVPNFLSTTDTVKVYLGM